MDTKVIIFAFVAAVIITVKNFIINDGPIFINILKDSTHQRKKEVPNYENYGSEEKQHEELSNSDCKEFG